MHLVIANKLYSSWSMRPWLVMRAFDIPFEETVIALKQPDTRELILEFSPSGKLPCLIDRDADGERVRIWESLAIIEYLAETFPDKAIWPRNKTARAHARAIANEMHAGFQALRQACPMNLGKRFGTPALSPDTTAAIARLEELWRETRARFGGVGPYLFGDFSAADAMYAPVATRLDTYSITVAPETRAYMDAIFSHPAFRSWRQAALAEPWTIADYEAGFVPVEVYNRARA
ncbi:MAG: glutathione S-transferase family protein [Pseudomonadota bacterium]